MLHKPQHYHGFEHISPFLNASISKLSQWGLYTTRIPEFPFNTPSSGLSLRVEENSGIGELVQENKAGLWFAILLEQRVQDSGWQKVPQTPSLGFRSNLWYHTPTPNRIPTIPTLGCLSSCFHVANCNPLEEIHIGIQTPEHLAKPNPAGLRMRHWPPLEPQPTSPCQWPALPLPDKRSLPTHLFHTDVQTRTTSPYVLIASQRVLFFKSCSNHEIVGMSCACVSHQARTHSAENKSGQESSQVRTKNKLDN